jgi:hypothetical protein
MNKMRQLKSRGSAIALVMIALIILLIGGVGLLGLGSHSRLFAVQSSSSIAAQCAADAGLAKALFEMKERLKVKPWDDSTLPYAINESLPNSSASYSYKVGKDTDGKYVIESIGACNQSSKGVRCKLRIDSPFDVAIFGNEYISLKSGTSITGYNINPGNVLSIGTNSTEPGYVFARTDVFIDGDVFVGAGGDPDVVIDSRNEAVITGDCYAQEENLYPPSVVVPKYLELLPSLDIIKTSCILEGPSRCEAIELNVGNTILIDGPVILYCHKQLTLDVLSQIRVVDTNPDAFLIAYVGGDFTLKSQTQLNNTTKNPQKLKIYMLDTAKNIQFINDADFYGAIYGPNTDLLLANAVKIYGSVITNGFSQNVGSDFYYDGNLQEGTVHDEFVDFAVDKWSE